VAKTCQWFVAMMTSARSSVVVLGVIALIVSLAACGGSGSKPPSISVSISNPPTSVAAGATATLTAVVTNDSSADGVTWTVHCGGSACGSVNPTSSAGNSSNTTFTAPATVPTGNTVTVTATSSADTTKSASVSITITSSTAISVVLSNPPTSLGVGASATLTATVTNDSRAAGVTWTVACGSSACGNFSPTTSTGNTATTTYTAPASVPTGNTVTVTATSLTDNTKSATATITITNSTAVLADGNYVFRISGDDGNAAYFLEGVFTVSKGAITGGEEDLIDFAQGGQASIQATGSGLTSASDGNFQLVLATNDSNFGVNGVQTFRGALVSSAHAQIDEFDSFAAAQGTLDLQTSTSAPSGGFAFNLGGIDGAASPGPLFIGGVLTVSGTSVSVSNSVFDYFDGGAVGQAMTFASGTLTAPDSFGRLSISLNPSQGSGGVPFTVIGYIVGTNQLQLVESPSDTLGGTLGGTALGQGANNGTFTVAGVGGHTYVFTADGEDELNGMATFAGAFALNAGGTVSGNLAYNDITSNQNLTISGGNWTVDSLGRVALSNVMVTGSNIGNGPFSFQFYLDGNGNALQLGTDTTEGSSGLGYQQTSTQQIAGGKYVIGAQGFAATQGKPTWAAVGPVTLDSSLNWSGFTDYNVFGGTPAANVTLSGTTNPTTSIFSITGLNAVNPPPATPQFAYWPIDTSRALAIELDAGQSGSFLLQAVSQ
jgi:hypothetical protein